MKRLMIWIAITLCIVSEATHIPHRSPQRGSKSPPLRHDLINEFVIPLMKRHHGAAEDVVNIAQQMDKTKQQLKTLKSLNEGQASEKLEALQDSKQDIHVQLKQKEQELQEARQYLHSITVMHKNLQKLEQVATNKELLWKSKLDRIVINKVRALGIEIKYDASQGKGSHAVITIPQSEEKKFAITRSTEGRHLKSFIYEVIIPELRQQTHDEVVVDNLERCIMDAQHDENDAEHKLQQSEKELAEKNAEIRAVQKQMEEAEANIAAKAAEYEELKTVFIQSLLEMSNTLDSACKESRATMLVLHTLHEKYGDILQSNNVEAITEELNHCKYEPKQIIEKELQPIIHGNLLDTWTPQKFNEYRILFLENRRLNKYGNQRLLTGWVNNKNGTTHVYILYPFNETIAAIRIHDTIWQNIMMHSLTNRFIAERNIQGIAKSIQVKRVYMKVLGEMTFIKACGVDPTFEKVIKYRKVMDNAILKGWCTHAKPCTSAQINLYLRIETGKETLRGDELTDLERDAILRIGIDFEQCTALLKLENAGHMHTYTSDDD
eukprot:6369_1